MKLDAARSRGCTDGADVPDDSPLFHKLAALNTCHRLLVIMAASPAATPATAKGRKGSHKGKRSEINSSPCLTEMWTFVEQMQEELVKQGAASDEGGSKSKKRRGGKAASGAIAGTSYIAMTVFERFLAVTADALACRVPPSALRPSCDGVASIAKPLVERAVECKPGGGSLVNVLPSVWRLIWVLIDNDSDVLAECAAKALLAGVWGKSSTTLAKKTNGKGTAQSDILQELANHKENGGNVDVVAVHNFVGMVDDTFKDSYRTLLEAK